MPPKCPECGEYFTRERPCRCYQPNPATVPSGQKCEYCGGCNPDFREIVCASCNHERDSKLQDAVRLLERQDKAYGKYRDTYDWYTEHYPLVEDIESFLARHRAGSDSNSEMRGKK